MTDPKVNISLYIEAELKAWLDKQATKENRPLSNLIETILKEHKEKKK